MYQAPRQSTCLAVNIEQYHFSKLRPLLDQASDLAEQRSQHLISRYRGSDPNLRTKSEHILRRADVTLWERLFHNLRVSRETELKEESPFHVVCAWIGNSTVIVAQHYFTVSDAHFAKADCATSDRGSAESGALRVAKGARNAAQPTRATECTVDQKSNKTRQKQAERQSDAIALTFGQAFTVPVGESNNPLISRNI